MGGDIELDRLNLWPAEPADNTSINTYHGVMGVVAFGEPVTP
jgi:hypothetical protein